MTFVMDNIFSTFSELFALVWMELLMVVVAALGYAVFMGRTFPQAGAAQKKKKFDLRSVNEGVRPCRS